VGGIEPIGKISQHSILIQINLCLFLMGWQLRS